MGKEIAKTLIHIRNDILEFIYPWDGMCVNCGEETAYSLCYKCTDTIKKVDLIDSYGYHGGALSNIIRKFKMLRDFNCGRVLSELLIEKIIENDLIDYTLTYVPMSRASFKKRGFNQSKYLCEIISLELNMDMKKSLKKIKKTREQKSCSGKERKTNIKDAFKAVDKGILGEKFLIIDDVKTTGATLEECIKTLKNAGAIEVKGLTASRSQL